MFKICPKHVGYVSYIIQMPLSWCSDHPGHQKSHLDQKSFDFFSTAGSQITREKHAPPKAGKQQITWANPYTYLHGLGGCPDCETSADPSQVAEKEYIFLVTVVSSPTSAHRGVVLRWRKLMDFTKLLFFGGMDWSFLKKLVPYLARPVLCEQNIC